MIAYLKGKIIHKAENLAIIEANNVGYEAHFSLRAFEKLPTIGQECQVFCFWEVNERGNKLFGFLTYDELELFKIVRSIQGVGPKASLEISSLGSLAKIKEMMDRGDMGFLNEMPGIGAKRGQKIILEISGKIKSIESLLPKNKKSKSDEELLLALKKLGFKQDEIKKAISALPKSIINTQEKIKEALKILGK